MDGQGTTGHRNIAEKFNRLSRVHERYRQTDGRTIAYSEHELEFTFAKNRTLQLPTTLQHHCPTRILPYNHINIRIHADTTPTHMSPTQTFTLMLERGFS